eukprot:jgi/Psemu1/38275/gm1.38275_g
MTTDNPMTDSDKKPDNEASKKTNAWSNGKKQNKTSSKRFQGGTTGLEDDIFYFGKGMNTKWLDSKEKLLNYIGKKYNETTALVNQNLTSCYAIIWGQLTQTLRNKIKAESDFDKIDNAKNSPKLFTLVTKIFNQTATIDHQPTAIITSLYTMIGLNGLNMTFSNSMSTPSQIHPRRAIALKGFVRV